jgi:hypothetical protein
VNPTLQPAPADDAAQADPDMPDGKPTPERKALGTLLVEAGLIDEAQLDLALREGSRTGERVGEVVVRRRWATEDEVARVLADQWGLSYVDRASIWFDADALTRLSREDAQRLEALPTRVEGGRVVVAVAEPTEQRLAALEKLIGDTVVVVVPKTALEAGLHSELLTSRSGTVEEPSQDDAPAPEPEEPTPEQPPPASVPPPAPVDARGPVPGLQGFSALAAQAQRLADLMAEQAAVTNETEELAASKRRIEELESELAAHRVAVEELKRHLEAALRVLERGF